MSDFKFLTASQMSRLSLEERQAYLRQVIDIEINDDERSQMEDDGRSHDDENSLTGPDDCESDAEIEEAEVEIGDGGDSDNDSHSDDESDSDAEQSNEYGQDEIPGEYFIGKDGTRWQKQAPPLQRIRQQNVFRDNRFKGPNPVTKNLSDVETFCTILDSSITSAICRHTNRKAESIFQNYNEKYPDKTKQLWRKLDEEELLAYFGILLSMGSQRSNYERLDSLWRKNAYPLYRATMSAKRFRNITRFIRFDQQNTRADRMASDKAAPISEIFEMINANLRRSYRPYENITVDEQLYPFRGRTKFTQYIPSKPAKYGIKLWWACDSKSSYPLTGQIYTGKVGNTRDINQGERVVKDLVGYYKNTGRNITTDNFFTTVSLADTLLSWKLSMVGTMKKNKTCLPPEFKASS